MRRKFFSPQLLCRVGFYLLGLLVLALGISMNTKAGLGVSPIISVSYCISVLWNLNFGDMTFLLYGSFVIIEGFLHWYMDRQIKGQGERPLRPLPRVLLLDVLQLPLSLAFTRFLNVFGKQIPDLATDLPSSFWGSLAGQLLFLLAAIVLTGIGAALSLGMCLIPNPGDGIVQAIADTVKKSVGFCKNCVDIICVAVTVLLSFAVSGQIVGIGLGTVLAMLGVGRVIAFFRWLCFHRLTRLVGLPQRAEDISSSK